jgi:hypothetical protein
VGSTIEDYNKIPKDAKEHTNLYYIQTSSIALGMDTFAAKYVQIAINRKQTMPRSLTENGV